MAEQFSFDIVSDVNLQEVDNAVNQAKKELATRFDFRGTKSSIEFLKTDKKIRLVADDDLKLRNLEDILKTRLVSRKISVKALEFGTVEKAFEGTLRREAKLVCGIPQDKSKIIVQVIKNAKLKVQTAIQGEQLRISSKSKDDLQAVISLLREAPPVEIPLQFTNFR